MLKNVIVCFFLFLGILTSFSQIEERPANGPRGVKNVRDELNRRQGPWSIYNYDGDLLSKIEYVNDKKEGLSTYYYPGGGPEPEKIKEETYYFGGKKDSVSVKKYFSGQVALECAYDMGRKVGKWTYYYEDGQIKSEGNYVQGRRDGDWKWFNRKGVLIKTANYSGGADPVAAPKTKATKAPAGGAKK